MSELRVGLLGCGGMGMSLAEQCHDLPNATVAAVCDIIDERMAAAADKFGAAPYASYSELLEKADVDAVMIASPPNVHRPMAECAAAAGKHILCEKPMSPTVAGCDAMIAATEAGGVKLMIAQVLRYIPPFYWFREKIGSGEFGKVIGILVERIGGDWAAHHRVPWRFKRAESGGNLMEINAHELDFMRCIAGDATRVYAVGDNYIRGEQDYEDVVLASINFANGAVAVLHSSNACHGDLGAYAGRILYEGGTFFFDSGAGADSAIRYGIAGGDVQEQRIADIEVENPVRHEVRLFVEAVLNDTDVPVPGSEGRAVVELAQAAYMSIAEGRPIDLPL